MLILSLKMNEAKMNTLILILSKSVLETKTFHYMLEHGFHFCFLELDSGAFQSLISLQSNITKRLLKGKLAN